MRVLLLNYEFPPLGGGAGVATQALARGLASRGVTVDVITAGERDECRSEVLWDGHGEEGLLTVYRVKSSRTGVHEAGMGGAFSYLRQALPLVRARMRDEHYDIVHLFFSLPTGALLPFLSLGDTPVVVSLRGSDVPGYDRHQKNLERAHRALLPVTRWRCGPIRGSRIRSSPTVSTWRGSVPPPARGAGTAARSAALRSPGWWSARGWPT